jgi:hypothetical protein
VIVTARFFACLLVCGAIAQAERIAPCDESALAQVECRNFINSGEDGEGHVPSSSPRFKGEEQGRGDAANHSPSTSPTLHWHLSPDSTKPRLAYVELSGLNPAAITTLKSPRVTSDRWSTFFSVRIAASAKTVADEPPPLWGAFRVEGNTVRFQPRFPPEPGIHYRATFDPARLRSLVKELSPSLVGDEPKASESLLTADFFVPKSAEPRTNITAVYPSAERLPENVLRFYIHFSAPMSRGEAYRHLKLIDVSTKKPVHAPFLELEEELWSPDGKRFTLLIDPGRIKRGLKPREMFGPVLVAGKSYELIVDRDWTDAHGNALASEFRRSFHAGPPDETMPNPKEWSIRPPRAGGREPLAVRFPEQLDSALAQRLIAVLDSDGKEVLGRVTIAEAETAWRFIPEAPWRLGTYRLAVGTELEDVAGNSVAAPFEVDLTEPITKRVASDRVFLPFSTEPTPSPKIEPNRRLGIGE